jgi:hypothetical protein
LVGSWGDRKRDIGALIRSVCWYFGEIGAIALNSPKYQQTQRPQG